MVKLMVNNKELVSTVALQIKQKFIVESSGHDWWHIYRVWKMAQRIGKAEKADMFIVELAALLHDVADWKFHNGDETVGPAMAHEMLSVHGVPNNTIAHVSTIIAEVSFKGAGVDTKPSTLEGKVVQDADRLDAIGAVGIARTFAYGGHKGRLLYDPAVRPSRHMTKEEYMKSESHTINHFYEKLLLLKDLMNTKEAKRIANKRHMFMKDYLEHFFDEWEGEA